jgi:hypothetical protein
MDYNVFLFIQLFNELFKADMEHLPIERIYKHWRETDILYALASSTGTYESIEGYLKSNFEGIRHILSK